MSRGAWEESGTAGLSPVPGPCPAQGALAGHCGQRGSRCPADDADCQASTTAPRVKRGNSHVSRGWLGGRRALPLPPVATSGRTGVRGADTRSFPGARGGSCVCSWHTHRPGLHTGGDVSHQLLIKLSRAATAINEGPRADLVLYLVTWQRLYLFYVPVVRQSPLSFTLTDGQRCT